MSSRRFRTSPSTKVTDLRYDPVSGPGTARWREADVEVLDAGDQRNSCDVKWYSVAHHFDVGETGE
jgi:hypothetical protein